MLLREYIRTLLEARPISIDKDKIRELAKFLSVNIGRKARKAHDDERRNRLPPWRGIGQIRKVWEQTYFSVEPVRGEEFTIRIIVATQPGSGITAGAGMGTNRNTGEPTMVVYLNANMKPGDLASAAETGILEGQLWPILIHELTHAADVFKPEAEYERKGGAKVPTSGEIDPVAYYNDPGEVRAHMQEIVDEVLSIPVEKLQAAFGSKGILYAVRSSETWKYIRDHLTPDNKKLILKAVYRELQEKGYV